MSSLHQCNACHVWPNDQLTDHLPRIINYATKLLHDEFDGTKGFAIDGGIKDASHIRRLTNEANCPMPTIDIAHQHLLTARSIHQGRVQRGDPTWDVLDWSAIIAGTRAAAGLDPFDINKKVSNYSRARITSASDSVNRARGWSRMNDSPYFATRTLHSCTIHVMIQSAAPRACVRIELSNVPHNVQVQIRARIPGEIGARCGKHGVQRSAATENRRELCLLCAVDGETVVIFDLHPSADVGAVEATDRCE